jgi:hypothetical protein
MSMPLPPEEEPTATVSAPQRTASQLGLTVRHSAPSMVAPVAGVHIQQQSQIAGVSPLSDPWNAQASASPAAHLMNPGYFRSPGASGALSMAEPQPESPVDGSIEGELAKTLGPDPTGEQAEARRQAQSAQAEAKWGIGGSRYQSDADPPSQGVHDLGNGRLTHLRMPGPTEGGLTGRYGVASDLGEA